MKKILVVDDESHIAYVLEERLSANGYEVTLAFSGPECLKKAQEEDPDLILLDIMMPGMNGFLTLQNLKKEPALKPIPVVMLTGRDQLQDVQKAVDLGALDYVMKPFESGVLLEKIRLVIGA